MATAMMRSAFLAMAMLFSTARADENLSVDITEDSLKAKQNSPAGLRDTDHIDPSGLVETSKDTEHKKFGLDSRALDALHGAGYSDSAADAAGVKATHMHPHGLTHHDKAPVAKSALDDRELKLLHEAGYGASPADALQATKQEARPATSGPAAHGDDRQSKLLQQVGFVSSPNAPSRLERLMAAAEQKKEVIDSGAKPVAAEPQPEVTESFSFFQKIGRAFARLL